MRSRAHRIASVLLSLAILSAGAKAAADSTNDPLDLQGPAEPATPAMMKEAREHFDRGNALYKDGATGGALAEFRRSYEKSANYKVLYNIGLVHRDERDYKRSLAAFERFLSEGDKKVDAGRKKEAEGEISQLRKFVGFIEVVTNVEGAEIFIDGEPIGASPLGKEAVNAGSHQVEARKEGRLDAKASVMVAGGETATVRLEIKAVPEAPPPKPAVAAPKEPPSRWDTISFVGLGLTGAFAVGAGVLGGLALAGSSDLDETRFVGQAPNEAFESDATRVHAFAITTDVLAGLAVATLGATLIYTFVHEPAQAAEGKPGSKPAASVDFNLSPFGAALSGSF